MIFSSSCLYVRTPSSHLSLNHKEKAPLKFHTQRDRAAGPEVRLMENLQLSHAIHFTCFCCNQGWSNPWSYRGYSLRSYEIFSILIIQKFHVLMKRRVTSVIFLAVCKLIGITWAHSELSMFISNGSLSVNWLLICMLLLRFYAAKSFSVSCNLVKDHLISSFLHLLVIISGS